jgi:membrane associated rhomboid family serine protease/antitoxin component YwqK of YwqJK toxin-antitoxin module
MPATLGLVLINTVGFILTFSYAGSLGTQDWSLTLLRLGAQFNPLTLDREWYRIFTHMFLHGGVVHFTTTMAALLFVGYSLEGRVGTKKVLFVYILSGLAAALNGLYWNLFTIGVGASGAIFGLLGFSLVLNIYSSGKKGRSMLITLAIFSAFVIINLVLPEAMYADYAAHYGGVMMGILIGFFSYVRGSRVAFTEVRIEYVMIPVLIVLYFLLPRYQVRYFRLFKQVVAAEDSTRHRFKENLTDDQYMRGFIKNFHHWEDVQTRLREQTNLPPELATDTFKLGKYINLRKQENMYKKLVVQREAYVYLDSVEYLQKLMQPYLNLDYGLWSRIKLDPEREDSASMKMERVYYDSSWLEIPVPPGTYYRVGFRDPMGRWDGEVQDFYGNGDVMMKGVYSKGRRHGIFIYYSPGTRYSAAGRYYDDSRFGKWETFHENGKLAQEIFYNDGVFVQNVWDSLGNQWAVDGNGKEIQRYPNGVIALEGEYRHGVKEGYWYGRHPNGEMYFEENFNGGVLVSGKSRSLGGETFIYDGTSLYPMPKGGFQEFYEYVKAETEKVDDDEMGHVKISFRVTSGGTLRDVVIVQSSGNAFLDGKGEDILLKGPPWLPARHHGHKPVEGSGLVQIEFY